MFFVLVLVAPISGSNLKASSAMPRSGQRNPPWVEVYGRIPNRCGPLSSFRLRLRPRPPPRSLLRNARAVLRCVPATRDAPSGIRHGATRIPSTRSAFTFFNGSLSFPSKNKRAAGKKKAIEETSSRLKEVSSIQTDQAWNHEGQGPRTASQRGRAGCIDRVHIPAPPRCPAKCQQCINPVSRPGLDYSRGHWSAYLDSLCWLVRSTSPLPGRPRQQQGTSVGRHVRLSVEL
jgi:hypothetical protein